MTTTRICIVCKTETEYSEGFEPSEEEYTECWKCGNETTENGRE